MPRKPLTVLIKPAGADCNLACTYCFYREKAALYPETTRHRMSDETLREMVRKYMNHSDRQVAFAWQGGEPTLMGLDFYKQAVHYQQLYGRPGQMVSNSLQTNAVLLDDVGWARFLHQYKFLVGVSIDGPPDVHDTYRLTPGGEGTHARVVRALQTLLDNEVDVNVLTMVTPANIERAAETYEYLLSLGVDFLQFIPLAERDPGGEGLADFTISPEGYGKFLCETFDLWAAEKPRSAYVRMFDDLLAVVMGHEHPTCMFAPECGMYVVIEHNGDLYACDFFVEPQWYYGNIHEMDFSDVLKLDGYQQFRQRKTAGLDQCRQCKWFSFCHGGCPKYRVMLGDAAQPTHFCESYRMLFEHSWETLQVLARKLRARETAREQNIGRNDPCPCGSGKKFKDCCMP